VASMVSSVGLVDPSYLSTADGLKLGGHITFVKSRENDLIPPESQALYGERY
jgi:hypothetical protein